MQKLRPRPEDGVKKSRTAVKAPPVQPAQCGSCIFRENHPEAEGRRKTIICRGGRDWQLQVWHRIGLNEAPTDEAQTVKMVALGLWQEP